VRGEGIFEGSDPAPLTDPNLRGRAECQRFNPFKDLTAQVGCQRGEKEGLALPATSEKDTAKSPLKTPHLEKRKKSVLNEGKRNRLVTRAELEEVTWGERKE